MREQGLHGFIREEVDRINEAYRAELAVYEEELKQFREDVDVYQECVVTAETNQANYRIAIESSILPAEELIRQFYPGFGWTYVDKDDTAAYRGMILQTWAAQLIIIFILFVLIMLLLKRKDVVK